jgi:hypothetical protein
MNQVQLVKNNSFFDPIYNGLGKIYNGACEGAAAGAIFGVSMVAVAPTMKVMEIGGRTLGCEPKWPILKGDCQLQQFKNTSLCTQRPIFLFGAMSPLDATIYLIGLTTLLGMLGGVLRAVVCPRHL